MNVAITASDEALLNPILTTSHLIVFSSGMLNFTKTLSVNTHKNTFVRKREGTTTMFSENPNLEVIIAYYGSTVTSLLNLMNAFQYSFCHRIIIQNFVAHFTYFNYNKSN